MASLNSLFNRASFGTRCKTCVNLSISRIKLLRNKREAQLLSMRKEISQYLQTGQESIARIRVEHIIREQNILAAYEIIEVCCEFILARVPVLESQKECPVELRESIASVIFASSRCSDLPDLMHLRNLFVTKYGKEFVAAALELRPDSGVNRKVIENLSVQAPSADSKLTVLRAIAQEFNLKWDSSNTEMEFNKKYEDLLDGSRPGQVLTADPLPDSLLNDQTVSTAVAGHNQPFPVPAASSAHENAGVAAVGNSGAAGKSPAVEIKNDSSDHTNEAQNTGRNTSDVLEKARIAIDVAERAVASARRAADLVKVRYFIATDAPRS